MRTPLLLLVVARAAALTCPRARAPAAARLRRPAGPARPAPPRRRRCAAAARADAGGAQSSAACGYVIGAGSVLLYAPILYEVAAQRSADGLALSTFALSLAGYGVSAAYSYQKGFPASTYVETVALSAQSLALCAGATALMTVSLLPQIVLNFQRRSGGQWSAITAGLSVGGNAIRAFTTLTLTKDTLLLCGFLLGLALNATLLGQIALYAWE
ncbi:hypothetical protein JL721_10906 [Aureococcus anophagefferens]|nr:hypothetical protein JL721_10906 [Aureococcus anophagefferens]